MGLKHRSSVWSHGDPSTCIVISISRLLPHVQIVHQGVVTEGHLLQAIEGRFHHVVDVLHAEPRGVQGSDHDGARHDRRAPPLPPFPPDLLSPRTRRLARRAHRFAVTSVRTRWSWHPEILASSEGTFELIVPSASDLIFDELEELSCLKLLETRLRVASRPQCLRRAKCFVETVAQI